MMGSPQPQSLHTAHPALPLLTLSSSTGEICHMCLPYTSSCWIFPLFPLHYELCATSGILSSYTAQTTRRKGAWWSTHTPKNIYWHLLPQALCRVFPHIATLNCSHPPCEVSSTIPMLQWKYSQLEQLALLTCDQAERWPWTWSRQYRFTLNGPPLFWFLPYGGSLYYLSILLWLHQPPGPQQCQSLSTFLSGHDAHQRREDSGPTCRSERRLP